MPAGRLARAPGKSVLSALSDWSKTELNVSFGATAIASEMRASEVPDEIRTVLSAIEHNDPLL
jgi:hypothetical protein